MDLFNVFPISPSLTWQSQPPICMRELNGCWWKWEGGHQSRPDNWVSAAAGENVLKCKNAHLSYWFWALFELSLDQK